MNDRNGPIFWNGQYHMFFQFNPNAAVWGDMHWAHAMSPDMLHWQYLPVALAPTPGGYDSEGCFSGSAVNDNGVATFIYTGVKTVSPSKQLCATELTIFSKCSAWRPRRMKTCKPGTNGSNRSCCRRRIQNWQDSATRVCGAKETFGSWESVLV